VHCPIAPASSKRVPEAIRPNEHREGEPLSPEAAEERARGTSPRRPGRDRAGDRARCRRARSGSIARMWEGRKRYASWLADGVPATARSAAPPDRRAAARDRQNTPRPPAAPSPIATARPPGDTPRRRCLTGLTRPAARHRSAPPAATPAQLARDRHGRLARASDLDRWVAATGALPTAAMGLGAVRRWSAESPANARLSSGELARTGTAVAMNQIGPVEETATAPLP
jgi:hypothetical protein